MAAQSRPVALSSYADMKDASLGANLDAGRQLRPSQWSRQEIIVASQGTEVTVKECRQSRR